MKKSLQNLWSIILVVTSVGCSSFRSSESTDTLFKAEFNPPSTWTLIDEGKWGFRLNAPSSFQDKGFEADGRWVHISDSMKIAINFGKNPSEIKLKRKQNYKEKIGRFNGLLALLCFFDEPVSSGNSVLKKVTAIYFLEKRKQMSGANEPSFQIEYDSEADAQLALQILQTLNLYDS